MNRKSKKKDRLQKTVATRLDPGIPFPGKQGWIFGFILILAVVIAYQPVWHAGFVWDDDLYVTGNKLLWAPDGLKRIWFSFDSPSQYFPLTYTAFRLEYALWGLNPTGYHWVNILLHGVNAVLVWQLLRRLNLPGAWLGAAIWALHPVQVESVAWVTELKNVLMCFFFLLTLLAWVGFVEGKPERRWTYYGLALVCYALALFSKTTACTLPAALLLMLWLKGRPINWRRLAEIIPFIAMGMGMGLLTMWWERYHQGTQGQLFAMGALERVLVASRAMWFYAGKLLWPVNLTFSYPHWTISASNPLAYLWLVLTAGLGAAIYYARRYVGRSVEVGVLFFVSTLLPVSGFIMLYTFRYSFVADHYQYIASLGLMAPGSAGISILFRKIAAYLNLVICGALLLMLSALTWWQCGMYGDVETLWRTTIARNPTSWIAHSNLGAAWLQKGEADKAITESKLALQINPDSEEAHNNLGYALLQKGSVDEAIVQCQEALRLQPDDADAHNNLGNALFQKNRKDEAMAQYEAAVEIDPDYADAQFNLGNTLLQAGKTGDAILHYQRTLQINPDYTDAENNLAWVLATAPQASLRNGKQAVELAERANQSSGGANPVTLRTLAAAYAEAGRFDEARRTDQRALVLARAAGQSEIVNWLNQELKLYEAGQPFHRGTK